MCHQLFQPYSKPIEVYTDKQILCVGVKIKGILFTGLLECLQHVSVFNLILFISDIFDKLKTEKQKTAIEMVRTCIFFF